MSVRNSHTKADYLDWNTMLNLIRKLYRDGDYRMSLFIGSGSFFGLSIIAKTKCASFKNETSKSSLFSLPFFSGSFDRLNIN